MKILCVLYDDPKNGMPEKYARDDLPKLDKYPDGMSPVSYTHLTLPTNTTV